MMKKFKIAYWTSTGLLSAMLIMSATMYVVRHEEIIQVFESFGYPTYIIYPLAIAKVSAVVVLLTQKVSKIKEWAYSALFFELILAFFAHYMISDGEQIGAVMAMTLLVISYITGNKIFKTENI